MYDDGTKFVKNCGNNIYLYAKIYCSSASGFRDRLGELMCLPPQGWPEGRQGGSKYPGPGSEKGAHHRTTTCKFFSKEKKIEIKCEKVMALEGLILLSTMRGGGEKNGLLLLKLARTYMCCFIPFLISSQQLGILGEEFLT